MRLFKDLAKLVFSKEKRITYYIYEQWIRPKPSIFDNQLVLLNQKVANPKVLVIGAHSIDFKNALYRSIYKWRWEAYLVEANPYLANKLKLRAAKLGGYIKVYDVAIGAEEGEAQLMVPNNSRTGWMSQLSSVNERVQEVLNSKYGKDAWDYLKVPCLSLSSFIANENIEELDLLVIDAEGEDYGILYSLDFAKIKPKILFFEHYYMSSEQIQCISSRFEMQGYQIQVGAFNTLATCF